MSPTERELLKQSARRPNNAQSREVLAKRSSTDINIVPIEEGDMVLAVARLHFEAFAGYLNTYLGMRYIRALLHWFLHADGAIAIAALDREGKNVLGYAIGAPVGYTRALNRELFWIVMTQILRRPSLLLHVRFWNKVRARLKSLVKYSQAQHQIGLPEPIMSLVAIGVAPSARKKGVGLRLLQAFEAMAAEIGIHSLLLSVYRHNTDARHFYEKCGWQIIGDDGKSEGLCYSRKLIKK